MNNTDLAISLVVARVGTATAAGATLGRYTLFDDSAVVMDKVAASNFTALSKLPGFPQTGQVTADDVGQVQLVTPTTYSENTWTVSPPTLSALETFLEQTDTEVTAQVKFTFTRSKPPSALAATGATKILFTAPEKAKLAQIVNQTAGTITSMVLQKCISKWWRLTATTQAEALTDPRPCVLTLVEESATRGGAPVKYWKVSRPDGDEQGVPGPGGEASAGRAGRVVVPSFTCEAIYVYPRPNLRVLWPRFFSLPPFFGSGGALPQRDRYQHEGTTDIRRQ